MKNILALAMLVGSMFCSAVNAQEVKLLQATSEIGFSFANFFKGDILVENVAYDKVVTVVVSINDGEWQEFSADYVETLDTGLELWRFHEMSSYTYSDYQFAVKYEVNGVVFWDNNNGLDYVLSKVEGGRVESNFILQSDIVVKNQQINDWRRTKEGEYYFSGELYLQNVAYEKQVDIIYSFDNWQTVESIPAKYSRSNNESTSEKWIYSIYSDQANAHVEFAIRYRVDGDEYWDNNFGRNYSR